MNDAKETGALESLVVLCLKASEQGEDRLDELCALHPYLAKSLRQRMVQLAKAGLAEESDRGRGGPRLAPAVEAPPQWIGPYRVLETLGEGGMGTVYLAEQREPVRRRVAVKVIKLGMDSKQVLARFEAERQALALMNHEHIARVFDAGITDRGQPYFAMEHVHGLPFTEYCDRERLSIPDRLKLFQRVCSGVQHAHQKGVVHRDLKPTNVLVVKGDSGPVPKIIDFGLARAVDHQLVAATVFTEHGQIVGTPEYMSPEQAATSSGDIDIRTDVYSLGVMLYELLAGQLPFSAGPLRAAGLSEMERRIREDDPGKPSTRVTGTSDDSAQAAKLRRCSGSALARALRGELDWITMKALEKDRDRRYVTAAAFEEDLGRFLRFEPVQAGPPSARYRIRKLVRRHRLLLAGVATVAVALIALAWGAVESARADREAETAQREATVKREALTMIHRLFISMGADRSRTSSGEQLHRLFERGAEVARSSFAELPEQSIEILENIGYGYLELGLDADALSFLEEARGKCLDQKIPISSRLWNRLGGVYERRDELKRAATHFGKAIEAAASGGSDLKTATHNLINTKRRQHDYEVAGELAQQWQTDYPEALEDPEFLENVAKLVMDRGELESADSLFEAALTGFRAREPVSVLALVECLNNHAVLQRKRRSLQDAEGSLQEALEIGTPVLGEDDLLIAQVRNTLGFVYTDLKRFDAAEAALRLALDGRRSHLPIHNTGITTTVIGLMRVLRKLNRHAEALRLGTARCKSLESELHQDDARIDLQVGHLEHARGGVLQEQSRFAEAVAPLERAIDIFRRRIGPDEPGIGNALATIAACYLGLHQPEKAEPLLQENLAFRERTGADQWRIVSTKGLIGYALALQSRFEEAEPLLQGCEERLVELLSPGHARIRIAREHLVDLYERWGKPQQAARYRGR